MSLEKLGRLVSELEFKKEQSFLYVIPGLLLPASFILLLYVYSHLVESIVEDRIGFIESRLLAFSSLMLIGYVVLTSYLSYRLTKIISQHMYFSGLFSYYYARAKDDYGAIKTLFKSSLYRRSIPSPITSLLINILSSGIFYPILIHIVESNLRKHVKGEEILFNKNSDVVEVDFRHLLLKLIATLFTLGLFLSYWGYRVVNLYNKHVLKIHRESLTAVSQTEFHKVGGDDESVLIRAMGLLCIGVGVSSLLSFFGVPAYLLFVYGSSPLAILVPLCLRGRSIKRQVFSSFLLMYVLLYSSAVSGLLDVEYTGRIAYWLMEDLSRMSEEFGLNANPYLTYIFLNNYAISVASSLSPLNPVLMGYSISNTGAILGGMIYINALEGGLGGGLSTLAIGILPHAVLELLAYAIYVTLAVNIDKLGWRKALSLFSLASATLLLAALVESVILVTGLKILQRLSA